MEAGAGLHAAAAASQRQQHDPEDNDADSPDLEEGHFRAEDNNRVAKEYDDADGERDREYVACQAEAPVKPEGEEHIGEYNKRKRHKADGGKEGAEGRA